MLTLLLLLPAALAVASPCSPRSSSSSVQCPPFLSPPSDFPFSSSPGCGHPSFLINCSSPHSLLTIPNAGDFFVLFAVPSSRSLLLSPPLSSSSSSFSPSPSPPLSRCSVPSSPINFSSSPFVPTVAACARLAAVPGCRPPANLSFFCNFSSFQLSLLRQPRRLLTTCGATSTGHRGAGGALSVCDDDTLTAFSRFLVNGINVTWLATDSYYTNCSSCVAAGGACGYNDSSPGKPFLCFPSGGNLSHAAAAAGNSDGAASASATRRFLIITTTLFGTACLVCLVLACLCVSATLERHHRNGAADTTAAFLRRHCVPPPVFTYEQLRAATDGFSASRKIGDGGFGSVYLAEFTGGRGTLAVKRLHRHHPDASSAATVTKSFCNEILILSSLRHPNLVRLHGYCADPRGLLLVYDYVPNGTLADHLHGRRSPFPWPTRISAAMQIAAALEYLHFSVKPPVVHRDVTSSNIFFEEEMRVRLGDFGLSRLMTLPDACSLSGSRELMCCCTGPQGTPGYLDPEYHHSYQLTEKSDVYSFGVVMLEMVTGKRAVDVQRQRHEVVLADLVVAKIQVGELRQVLDPSLVGGAEAGAVARSVEAVAELAFRCVAGDRDDRPNAREVGAELSRIQGKLLEETSGD